MKRNAGKNFAPLKKGSKLVFLKSIFIVNKVPCFEKPTVFFFKLLNPVNYRNSPRSSQKITGLIYRNSAPKAPGPKITGFRREAVKFFKNYMIFTGFQQKLQEFYRNLRKVTGINYWINAAEGGEKITGIPET